MEDEAFNRDAAKRGIFAYITLGRDASALQSSLAVVLSRFAYQGLEGAFARLGNIARTVVDQRLRKH